MVVRLESLLESNLGEFCRGFSCHPDYQSFRNKEVCNAPKTKRSIFKIILTSDFRAQI